MDRIPITEVTSVLLLGIGAGSIIESLRNKYDYTGPVTAIEIDPVVIEIAENEFGVKANELLEIHCIDAWDYIEQCEQEYDLIIIDIFIDIQVPEKFYKPQFWQMIEKNVSDSGFILFNAGIDMEEEAVREFVRNLPDSFISQKNYNVLKTNTVIIMQKLF